ncbi:MalY/PatB family protein [Flammeovirga kamogawensis]|uniref:cysteine-S-conjugate beta-lyase n=1 Tax=Flammeovirga kamogawensis TaxID=373891 RepID=A0ABX8GVF1_9BACT|nr:MalY/PatB family protein [Flammeovirga kamogawensis]MBB6461001.1 cystathionine beta-lyase [Flammeovirga kamogawensis]QWG07573.1 pyridoxal phosphate-dependent aminotransferase [Flammeovirga kamogawensis]TRX69385.1 pyridoxal phosphate-dependent aminotransferase [Flammeovirga kamogawensis]
MNYNFNKPIDRLSTDSVKYGLRKVLFGTEDIIPLWVADMDLPTAPEITAALVERMQHPIYGYTLQGDLFWESAINWIKKRHNWDIKKHEFTFTPGIVPAIGLLIQALSNQNERVAIFSPVYGPFKDNIIGTGRTLVDIPLINQNNFYNIDFDTLEKEMIKGLKLLVFCNPQNPSGRVWNKVELQKLLQLCEQYDVNIISDEIHADLVLFEATHTPLASLSEIGEKRVVTCMAPSKTFNLAGLNCAYLIFKNKELQKRYLAKVKHLHLDFGGIVATTSQIAAYNKGENWYQEVKKYFESNINYIIEELSDSPITVMKTNATYLLWLDCSKISRNNKILKDFFYKKAKVGVQDGEMFGAAGQGFMRMNIACARSILEESVKRIKIALD